ncbi:phage holin family protein [Nocardioides sp. BP30]|uniref:phage holin family protein n=1 Tax=Nocardioides sp. BP30 TaxID=3036374 RepID=UPI0024692603|nr:phage holin family protein [Nocardioides sp. BP30]WGL53164.1 phage holin family protein [Nocardioides sp. BP30]
MTNDIPSVQPTDHLEDRPEPVSDASAALASPTPSKPASTPELVSQLSHEVTRLVRDELRLAQLEVSGKAKKAGVGVGMFGAAGLIALFGLGTLIATAVLALALAVDAWLAALIVAVVLFAVAGIAALVGRNSVRAAAPPVPTEAMASTQRDVETAKEAAHR